MKSLIYSFSILLLLSFFYTSCKKNTQIKKNELVFDSLHVTETYHLFNDTSKPGCYLHLDFIYPADYPDTEILEKVREIFIGKFFGSSFQDLLPEAAAASYKKQYIEEFRRFESNLPSGEDEDRDEDSDESGYSYYLKIRNPVYYNENNILSFVVDYSNFAGGAHGSHSKFAFVVNLEDGSLVEENEIFGDNTSGYLSEILVRKIATQNNLSDPKELENIGFYDISELRPNGNFVIEKRGITYFFNEDEIAPYLVGGTEVTLPYEEISVYMKPEGPVAFLRK